MKRQSALVHFLKPVDKRIRDSETENESDVTSGSSIDSSTSDQASFNFKKCNSINGPDQ